LIGVESGKNRKNFLTSLNISSNNYSFLWVKLAVLNKTLIEIITFLIKNALKYYLSHALLMDPVDSNIFCSLLAGPCSLEYTRIKTLDYIWSDPNASELIERHKMHTPFNAKANTNHKILNKSHLLLQYKTNKAVSNGESLIQSPQKEMKSNCSEHVSSPTANVNPKEYVESLHRNLKTELIYGKNNVIVNQKEKSFTGYLSLHSNVNSLFLKWTPNELLNNSLIDENIKISKSKGFRKIKSF